MTNDMSIYHKDFKLSGPKDYELQADLYETLLDITRLTAFSSSTLKPKQKFGLQIIKPEKEETKLLSNEDKLQPYQKEILKKLKSQLIDTMFHYNIK